MKLILSFAISIFICGSISAQRVDMPKNMSPKENASKWSEFYAGTLDLNKTQQKQVYSVLLVQQNKLSAISSGKMKVDKEALRKIYFAPDEAYKDIFTTSQYMEYLTMQSENVFTAPVKK